jgi:hypothetical protein
VCRIDAGAIATEMVDGQCWIYVAIRQNPCNAMGKKESSTDFDFSVSRSIFLRQPIPAGI